MIIPLTKRSFSKKRKYIPAFFIGVLLSCNHYRAGIDKHGNKILGKRMEYSFKDLPTEQALQLIDTSAYYSQIYEGRYYNENERQILLKLVFNNAGCFNMVLDKLTEIDKVKLCSQEISSGGKYRINGNLIEFERFLPIKGGKSMYYSKEILTGTIKNDTITMYYKNSLFGMFKKEL